MQESLLWQYEPVVSITAQQFEVLKSRVAGNGRRSPAAVVSKPFAEGGRRQAIILGIDPSLRGTGYGVVRIERGVPQSLTYGTIRCPTGWERSRCFVRIAEKMRDLLKSYRPTVCVIEGLFYAQNFQTALLMGEARGASLVTVAEAGLDIYEIAPRKVKQAIVGYGAAHKGAVAKMVQRLLHLTEAPEPDAADALALALAHAQENRRFSLAVPKRI